MMKEKKVFLTVIIPSYNHENYIENCLSEVIKIDIPKDVIIIDDGSSDRTPFIIKQFIENNKNKNIQFIEKENSGLISSLNIGLIKTETEFLYLIASDDILNPQGIKEAVEYLIENPNIDFLIGGGVNFFEDGKRTPIYKEIHYKFFAMSFEKRLRELFLNYPSPLLLQSTVFRTSVLTEIGGWDTTLILDDYPMFVKLLSNETVKFIFNPKIETVLYRHHGVNSYKNIEKQYKMILQAMNKLAPSHLKNQALGNALGYYILKALQQFDIKVLFRLLYLSPTLSYPYAVQKMFSIIIKKIVRRT